MRVVISGFFVLGAALYAAMAMTFFAQERLVWAPDRIELSTSPATRHPEATLALIRQAFGSDNFSDEVLHYVRRSLEQVPSSYQASFLLAAYHGNRLDEPELTFRAFQAALRRYPSNGRLHLAFASWLLASRANGLWTQPTAGTDEEGHDRALARLKTAFQLEPELTRNGLEIARRYGVPPESWIELVPEGGPVQLQLLLALAGAGHRADARNLLQSMLQDKADSSFLGQASRLALGWGDLELALKAARRWQQEETASGGSWKEFARASLHVSRVYIALSEPDAAYHSFRQALKELPVSARAERLELICGMASQYWQGGRAVMAESLFAEAITLAPHHAPASLGLARIYQQTGDKEAAIVHYQKVLQLDPRNAAAKRELERLILEGAAATRPR